jgi:membrane-bound lytic murein transglycosylase D
MLIKCINSKPLLGLFLVFFLAGCQVSGINQPLPVPVSSSTTARSPETVQTTTRIRASTPAPSQQMPERVNLWERISTGLSFYDDSYHPSIDDELTWFANNQKYIDRISERAAPFLFWIVEEIEARGLPLELALLPVIESAYDPTANSSQSAAGLWQFMEPTAKSYGLNINWWYDGRRDPLASTMAALDYLEMLHVEFDNDWLLTLAAYNAGQGTVRRAIRRNDRENRSTEFWDLRLPVETKNHIPRLLAIATLFANAAEYGVELPDLPNEAYLELVELDFQIDLARAANAAALAPGLLRTLNPGYLQWATQPDGPQFVAVPKSKASLFRQVVTEIPPEQRLAWDRYEIRSGDTLAAIASSFNTRVDVLQSVNNLRGTRIIAGDTLMIPRSSESLSNFRNVTFQGASSSQPVPNSYRVRRGDNLWRIARRFDLTSNEIATWNDISLDSLLHPGQMLTLSPPGFIASLGISDSGMPQKISYQIIKGDSLERIANKFGLTITDIVSWNGLNPRALIFPGQQLDLYISSTDVN